MTVTDDAPAAPTWTLSDQARNQLTARAIALSEVYRVLRNPVMRTPTIQGGERFTGYGVIVVVADQEIVSVEIDGETPDTWEGWAVERAQFADADLEEADALVRAELELVRQRAHDEDRERRRPKPAPRSSQVKTGHVLDAVHPALRDQITQEVDGDFSRLVIHSPTRVEILPPQ